MVQIKDLGRRIELTSMDKHFHDISIGLYALPRGEGGQEFVIHTYSRLDGAAARLARLVQAMGVLGGMQAGKAENSLRFACGEEHRLAAKRVFIEACKLEPEAELAPLPLKAYDKKEIGRASCRERV